MLDISTINPYIRVAMHSILNKGTRIDTRIIFDYELIYIADGEFVLNYNGVDYNAVSGQFLFLPPGISHSFSVTKTDLVQPHIHFDMTFLPDSHQVPVCFKNIDELTEEEHSKIRLNILGKNPKTPFVTFSDKEKALQLFYTIVRQPKPSELTQKGLLIQLIDMLISDNFPEIYNDSPNSSYEIESQVKDFFDAGQGMAFTLDDIARQFNYSKYYLERRFKNRYGIGLISYRNHKRLQLAKLLLQTESVSIVADKLGFSSIYAFSRAVRNHFGCSPTELKKESR